MARESERLLFDVTYDNAVTRCRMISEAGEGVVERHIADAWPDVYDACGDVPRDQNPFFTHGVNNNNREEVAVYVGLVWELTDLGAREVLVNRAVPGVAKWFRQDVQPTRWEYATRADATDWSDRSGVFKRVGHVREPPGPSSGVYSVATWHELVDLLVASLTDAWTTLLVVGRPTNSTPLGEMLGQRRAPTLSSLVSGGMAAVDLTIGVDLGYYDSLEIVMGGDQRAKFERVVKGFRDRIATYESTLASVKSIDQFRAALDDLAGANIRGGAVD